MRRLQAKTVVVLVTVLGILGFSVSAASAATVAVVDGTVVFTAAPGEANDVRAGTWAAPPASVTLKVIDAGAPLTAGAGCQQLDANSVWCPEPIFTPLPLVVHAGDGADRVVVDDMDRRAVTLYGGAGDDTLHVGTSIAGAPTVLDGGLGDDTLSTMENGGGSPTLRGGPGNDLLTIGEGGGGTALGGDGNDRLTSSVFTLAIPLRLDGGDGNDTYAFGDFVLPDAIVPGPGIDTLDQSTVQLPFFPLTFDMSTCPACVERVIGTPADDHITGDQRSQEILGGDGNDVLDGGGGPDVISAQGGDDTVNSRDGSVDIVACGDGADTVTADRIDVVSRTCETVSRGASRR